MDASVHQKIKIYAKSTSVHKSPQLFANISFPGHNQSGYQVNLACSIPEYIIHPFLRPCLRVGLRQSFFLPQSESKGTMDSPSWPRHVILLAQRHQHLTIKRVSVPRPHIQNIYISVEIDVTESGLGQHHNNNNNTKQQIFNSICRVILRDYLSALETAKRYGSCQPRSYQSFDRKEKKRRKEPERKFK